MLVHKLLVAANKPLVLDADGINALIGKLKILYNCRAELILTPHPGELSRLLKLKTVEIQKNRTKIAQEFARKYNLVLVLKGYRSLVADASGQVYINKTGNPGMATAGSGDVLTGVITALLGQKLSNFDATVLGVYIHGLAGDIAAEKLGQVSMMATDIIDALPEAFKKINNS